MGPNTPEHPTGGQVSPELSLLRRVPGQGHFLLICTKLSRELAVSLLCEWMNVGRHLWSAKTRMKEMSSSDERHVAAGRRKDDDVAWALKVSGALLQSL